MIHRWSLVPLAFAFSLPVSYAVSVSLIAGQWGLTGTEQIRLAIVGLPLIAIAFGWGLRWSLVDRATEAPALHSTRERIAKAFPFRLKLAIIEAPRRINAVSVGGIWTGATILLSRGVVTRLSQSAQRMLMLHEVAHQTRHHAWIRQLTLIGLIIPFVHQWPMWCDLTSASGWSCALGLLAWSFFALRQVNQSLERDADVQAVRLATGLGWSPRIAAHDLSMALSQATECHRDRSNWTHPSLSDRMTWLQVAAESEQLERLSRQPLMSVAWIMLAIASLAALSVWSEFIAG